MQQVGGVYLPDGERHLVEWMRRVNHVVDGRLTYQHHKLEAALAHVTEWRGAIDVGAHCGLWSMHLARRFALVVAFEPIGAHRACFRRNVLRQAQDEGGDNVVLLPFAAGAEQATVEMHTAPTSSGDSWIKPQGDGRGETAPLVRLDDVLNPRDPVGFIKLDCEGYELFALQGAAEMLKRWRPVVCVEQKPGRAEKYGLPRTGAVSFLQELGAVLRKEMSGDFIMSWDAASPSPSPSREGRGV